MKFKVKRVEHVAIIDSMSKSLSQFSTLAKSLLTMDLLDAFEATQKKTETLSKAITEKIKADKTNVTEKDGGEYWTDKGQKEASAKIQELFEMEVEYDFPAIVDFADYPVSMANALYLLRGKLYKKA